MIVLDVQQETTGAVYFDIHHLEVQKNRKKPCYLMAGTLGDGWYEGEVSVSFDDQMDVTFADEWLDRSSLEDFFRRVRREDICAALSGILQETIGSLSPLRNRPTGSKSPEGPVEGEGPVRSVSCLKKRVDCGFVSSGQARWRAA
ncbi:MAG: hypothetical protein R2940_03485 [Syntrophotaleaceae bacterium]